MEVATMLRHRNVLLRHAIEIVRILACSILIAYIGGAIAVVALVVAEVEVERVAIACLHSEFTALIGASHPNLGIRSCAYESYCVINCVLLNGGFFFLQSHHTALGHADRLEEIGLIGLYLLCLPELEGVISALCIHELVILENLHLGILVGAEFECVFSIWYVVGQDERNPLSSDKFFCRHLNLSDISNGVAIVCQRGTFKLSSERIINKEVFISILTISLTREFCVRRERELHSRCITWGLAIYNIRVPCTIREQNLVGCMPPNGRTSTYWRCKDSFPP